MYNIFTFHSPVNVGVVAIATVFRIKMFLYGSQQHPGVNSQNADIGGYLAKVRFKQKRHCAEHAHDTVLSASIQIVYDKQYPELTVVDTRHVVDDVSDVVHLFQGKNR